jgi:Ca2+-binding RTX toxin-like protein
LADLVKIRGDGNDWLYGGGANTIIDLPGFDGSPIDIDGDDTLLGGSGNDVLVGGAGRDRLDGYKTRNGYGTNALNRDTLTGGADSDIFALGDSSRVYYTKNGYATITDWTRGDRIELNGKLSDYVFDETQSVVGTSDRDTQIFYDSNLIAILQDVININTASLVFV